ncbi:MAG TPA: alanine--tRNA ligase [Candidatus Acidoferrales bacterium]|nr:alanine--tRNA ligase [Candidatus Acidoferrales bacterium]
MTELKWPGNRIRETFLKFFEERGHKIVRSSSLVPANDPTLLFTNAGMNQFKDVFLGLEKRDYQRATTCQKCVRAGGKHNDLENVGFTNRHHTFFEMLGNFSFGDYFKKEAIAYAWELVTSPEWFAIPVEKLYFTVFGGAEISPGVKLEADDDAGELWIQTGAPKDRVYEIPGLKENFWAMGDTGPCGPCSEIFYDMGPAASDQGHTDCAFPCDCGRYVEIWNLVFMQFNRDASGKLNPLPKPSVDTGMGLERMAATLLNMQDPTKFSNYDTDLFTPLMRRGSELTGLGRGEETSLRIIADHSRAATFLIADGVAPSNDGRGYVLRKILNRALVNAGALEDSLTLVLPGMAKAIAKQMEGAYPELTQNIAQICSVLKSESARFLRTTKSGAEIMNAEIVKIFREEAKWRKTQPGVPVRNVKLPGELAFKLYDTFGLQKDVIEEAARVRDIGVDWAGFEREMQAQRERGRASWKGAHKEAASPVYRKLADTFKKTEPEFYRGTETRDSKIQAIVANGNETGALKAGQEGEIVLDRTAIYSESGGQVADTGKMFDPGMSLEVAEVRGAYYPVAGLIAHRIVAKEDLAVGDRVATVADAARRERVMRNHSGTHLVHAALRNILGTHVKQAGSLNAPDHLRFDFSHFTNVGAAELLEIEQQVNEEIRRDLPFQTDVMNIEDALASGALAFFGDKYPEQNVRVVTIADAAYPRGFYSKELCGGTHVGRTGEIGVFKIALEQSVAAGVRRIEALTGDAALAKYQSALGTLRTLAEMLNTGEDRVLEAVEKLENERKQLERQIESLKRKTAVSMADSLLEGARTVKGVKVVAANVPGVDREGLRQLADGLRQKMGSGMVVLATGAPAQDGESGKVALITAVTKDLTNRLHAGKIVAEIAKHVGGSGGGRPDLAEAGGRDVAGIETALAQVFPLVERLV